MQKRKFNFSREQLTERSNKSIYRLYDLRLESHESVTSSSVRATCYVFSGPVELDNGGQSLIAESGELLELEAGEYKIRNLSIAQSEVCFELCLPTVSGATETDK